MRRDAYFDILLSVVACSSWLSQVLRLGLWHSLSIKQPQVENSALGFDSHTWALSQASYLQTGSAPGWPCFPGELVTSLFESLRRQFPQEKHPQDLWGASCKDDWIVSRLQVSGIGWLLVCRKRPFSKLWQKESLDSNSKRCFYVNVSKKSWLPWEERWLTSVTRWDRRREGRSPLQSPGLTGFHIWGWNLSLSCCRGSASILKGYSSSLTQWNSTVGARGPAESFVRWRCLLSSLWPEFQL